MVTKQLRENFARQAFVALFGLAFAPAALCRAQESLTSTVEQKVSRAGIFFRADAPAALRSRNDPSLPVFLEIINGVEKTGNSEISAAAQKIARPPLELEGVNVYVRPAGAEHQFASDPLLLGESKDYSFDARTNGQPLAITDRLKKTLEIPIETLRAYLAQHFIGGRSSVVDVWVAFYVVDWQAQSTYLRVRLDAPPLPQLPNWYRGDPHYHSGYTDNPAERGYPLDVTKQAALQAGLQWLALTDHSTDLNPQTFADELREVEQLNDAQFVFIRGEEVTVASGAPGMMTTLHMIALPSPSDPAKGFPDPTGASDSVIVSGDGAPLSPAIPLKEALARIDAAGGFAYAAHPYDPISPLLRGGTWDLNLDFLAAGGKQLQPGLVGLEPWNRATTMTADDARDPYCLRHDADPSLCFQADPEANEYTRLEKGIALGWLPLLQKGLAAGTQDSKPFKVFLAAGSDAHGDFNYEATMDVVDFLSKPSRGISGYAENNALGKISTVVHSVKGLGAGGENVLQALRDGHSVLSNGPLLIAGFDRNSNGSLDDPDDVEIGGEIASPLRALPSLDLQWVSSEEFGPLQSIQLFVGHAEGESKPIDVPLPAGQGLASKGLYPVNLRPTLENSTGKWVYVRLMARTRNAAGEEFRCYTNPIWIRVTGS